jgi:hypothetical protein
MLETSGPIQPELRALDAYNAREALVAYLRGFGVTTVHTGHAPGELITGQTIVVKTVEGNVDDRLLKSPPRSSDAQPGGPPQRRQPRHARQGVRDAARAVDQGSGAAERRWTDAAGADGDEKSPPSPTSAWT